MRSAHHVGIVALVVSGSLPRFCVQALLHLRTAVSPEFGPDISPLKFTVDESLPDVLHVKITDAEGKRWQVPRSLLADSASEIAGAPAAPTAMHVTHGELGPPDMMVW